MKTLSLIAAIGITGFLASCSLIDENRDCPKDYGDGEITLGFDWTQFPDSILPQGMNVLFFPEKGTFWRYDFQASAVDTPIDYLPPSSYHVLAFNDDTTDVFFASDSTYSQIKAFTTALPAVKYADGSSPSSMPQEAANAHETLVNTPSRMWTAEAEDFLVPEIFSSPLHLTLFPRLLTPRYEYRIEDVENIDNLYTVGAVLSGMNRYVDLWTRTPSGPPVSLSLPLNMKNFMFTGEFFTFGPSPSASHFLFVYAKLQDGRQFYYAYDVTSQVDNAPDPMNVLIVVKGLPIPAAEEPSGSGGSGNTAFKVDVDGWVTTVIQAVL